MAIPKIKIENRYINRTSLSAAREIETKIIAKYSIKLINFLLTPITVIAVPPISAPIPSREVKMPI